ncbi:unnamed protein product [Effrenium voratum]|nr:unnamed protein product [Effrenium voratum]
MWYTFGHSSLDNRRWLARLVAASWQEKSPKKKKKARTQEEPRTEGALGSERTESLEEVPDPPPVLPVEGSRPEMIPPLRSARELSFSIRSLASNWLWIDSCELAIGCTGMGLEREDTTRTLGHSEVMVASNPASPTNGAR